MIGPESVRIALQGLAANRLRSGLTILGMIIGVASVIILLAVGDGSSRAVQQRIESLGTNVLLVLHRGPLGGAGGFRAAGPTLTAPLTLDDAKALSDSNNAPDVASVSPAVNASATAVYNGVSYSPQQFVGTNPSYATAHSYQMAAGTFFNSNDLAAHARVAVLGQTVVANLFGGQDPVGQSVRINGTNFQVIGVTARKGTNGFSDQDDVVIAPLTTVQDAITGFGSLSSITVQAQSRGQLDAATAEVTSILDSRHHITNARQADFRVLNQGALLQTSSATGQVFTTLLGAVAAISLLVAGIGVMNIMLVTVTERTREIGIRKAIGARKTDILAQFLVEAVLVSVFGGVLGVGMGILGSQFQIAGVQPYVQAYSVILAFGVAVAIGLFFGLYPANRAASLQPIEALRFE
ncbi:MAG TPA: ABC transporter permease [Solirubrobacteraceae bacterium]|nr:ABC transporter permease [Solirubrobacteraceae bacterium]